jgi:hypothetical protein
MKPSNPSQLSGFYFCDMLMNMNKREKSQHILACQDLEGLRDNFLFVALSWYHKSKDLGYTLSCYCIGSFTLSSSIKSPSHVICLSSKWTDSTPGSNPSHSSFNFNPTWNVMPHEEGAQIQLKSYAPKTIFINLKPLRSISDSNTRESLVTNSRPGLIDTGDHRDGFVASAVKPISEGSYILVSSPSRMMHAIKLSRNLMALKKIDCLSFNSLKTEILCCSR